MALRLGRRVGTEDGERALRIPDWLGLGCGRIGFAGGLVFSEFPEGVPVHGDDQVDNFVQGFRLDLPGREGIWVDLFFPGGAGLTRFDPSWLMAPFRRRLWPVPGQEVVQALLPLFHLAHGFPMPVAAGDLAADLALPVAGCLFTAAAIGRGFYRLRPASGLWQQGRDPAPAAGCYHGRRSVRNQ